MHVRRRTDAPPSPDQGRFVRLRRVRRRLEEAMTRETERWQEQMRYAMDAGVLPPAPRRRGRRFLLAFLGVGSALIAFASYAGRGPAEAPRIDPVVEPS